MPRQGDPSGGHLVHGFLEHHFAFFLYGVHYGENGAVDRGVLGLGGLARAGALDEQHQFAGARPDGVDADQRIAARLVVQADRLYHQKFGPHKLIVLAGADHVTDYSCE